MSSKDRDNLIGCLVAIIALVVLVPLASIFQGWVLTVLWGWFVVPVFRVPELSIVAAIGLTLVIGMFKSYNIKKQEKSFEEKLTEAIAVIAVPLLMLLFGWIVHLFM